MGEVAKGLAERINAEHRAVEEAARSAVEHAIRCGEMLSEKKAQLQHGEWGSWLAENFEGSERAAQTYMKLYRERDALNPQRASDLSIRGALRDLSAPKEQPGSEQETLEQAGEEPASPPATDAPPITVLERMIEDDGQDWDFGRDVPLTEEDIEYLIRVARETPEIGKTAVGIFFGDDPCDFAFNPHGIRDPYTAVLIGRVRAECGWHTYRQLFEQVETKDAPLVRTDNEQLKFLLGEAAKGEPDRDIADMVSMVGTRYKIQNSVAQLSYLAELCQSGVRDEDTAEMVRAAGRENQSIYAAHRAAS